VYVVLQTYMMPPYTGSSGSREFTIQKYSVEGTLDTTFDADGSKVISLPSSSSNERFVFADDGSFAVQSVNGTSASIQVFSATGVAGQVIALDSSMGQPRLLGMSADQLFVQTNTWSSANDMHVFSTSSGKDIGSFSSSSTGYGSAYFNSYNTVMGANESFAVTPDGKFVWSDSYGVHSVNSQMGRTDFPGGVTSGMQSNGKFYSYSTDMYVGGKLSVFDASTQNTTEYPINLNGKAFGVSLVGVGDDGSILLSSISLSVPGLPSGLTGLFKLNLTGASGSPQYQLDNTFGEEGMLLSSQSIGTNDVKAVVGDAFLSFSNMSSDVSDLNIWDVHNQTVAMAPSLSDGSRAVYVTIPANSSEATFYVNANSDFKSEALESLQFTVVQAPNAAPGMYPQYTVNSAANTVQLSVEDVQLALGIDLNASGSQGIQRIETGPNDFYQSGSTTPPNYNPTYGLNQPKLYDALVNSNKDISQLKMSVKPGEFVDSTNSVQFDFKFGNDSGGMYASSNSVQSHNFKIKLGDADSLDKDYYFTQYVDGSNHLFSVRQTATGASPQSYEFTISTEDGMALSPQAASNLVSNIGLSYSDPTMSQYSQHHISFDVQVSALDVLGDLVGATSLDSDKAVFEFSNLQPQIYDAAFNGKFIQLMFHSGPSSELNYDVGDGDDYYNSWRGHPDKSHFTVKVNVNGDVMPEYQIQEVIQNKSVLLVLNQALPENAEVTVSYNDWTYGDNKQFVIQSWQGNDAESFENFVAQYGHTMNVKGEVLSGAELGWDTNAEESGYLNVDWDPSSITGKVLSVSAGGQAVVEFHTTGWHPNPNFDSTKLTGLQSDPYAQLVLQTTLSKDNWTPKSGDSLSLSEALGFDKGYNLFSFKTMLNTSNELGQAPSANSIESHELMVYSVPTGVPFSYLASSNFNFADLTVSGSAHDDFLGDASNIGRQVINAGDGDDVIVGGIGNDRFDGGKGADTLRVSGLQNDFIVTKTGANTFTLEPKAVTLPVTPGVDASSQWDAGGTDQLISIESIQFDDGLMTLDSVDPSMNTSVTAFAASANVVRPTESGFDYLDLTGLTVVNGAEINSKYLLEADFETDAGLLMVDGTAAEYQFSGFEGYIVAGSASSTLANDATIKVTTHASENDIVLVKSGDGLEIDLGHDAGSEQDVLSFRGTNAGVTIDLNPIAGSQGWVSFSTLGSPISSGGTSKVHGADLIFGSESTDSITGFTNQSNLLAGFGGNDTLTGGNFADLLVGGAGNDLLIGGAGNDTLIDLGKATLKGGEGKDLFVVRGGAADEDVASIYQLELSPEGLSRGGVNAQTFMDRVTFNFSTAAFANTALAPLVAGATGSLSAADYLKLRNAIELKVETAANPANGYVVSAYIKEAMSATDATAGFLGRVDFSIKDTLLGSESIRAVKLAQSSDFMTQFSEPVMDQMLTNNGPLAVAGNPELAEEGQMFSETVSLVFGLEKTDKFTVSPLPGEHPPVLMPVVLNGMEYATRFQLGNANESVMGSHKGDAYQFVRSDFIDANGVSEANQTFGSDVIIERGGAVDAARTIATTPSITSVAFDNTGRDVVSFADDKTDTGLSIQDLLVGDFDLARWQKGREGAENSLKITYHDSTPDDTSLNDVNLGIYKQYIAHDASFRVEDLQLLDMAGKATRFDLGQSFKGEVGQGLTTYDARDAILLGKSGVDDTFKLVNSTTGEPDHVFDVFLQGFNFANDKIQIEGYGAHTAQQFGVVASNDSKLTLTLDNGTAGVADDYTLNLYFVDTVIQGQDELLWLKSV